SSSSSLSVVGMHNTTLPTGFNTAGLLSANSPSTSATTTTSPSQSSITSTPDRLHHDARILYSRFQQFTAGMGIEKSYEEFVNELAKVKKEMWDPIANDPRFRKRRTNHSQPRSPSPSLFLSPNANVPPPPPMVLAINFFLFPLPCRVVSSCCKVIFFFFFF